MLMLLVQGCTLRTSTAESRVNPQKLGPFPSFSFDLGPQGCSLTSGCFMTLGPGLMLALYLGCPLELRGLVACRSCILKNFLWPSFTTSQPCYFGPVGRLSSTSELSQAGVELRNTERSIACFPREHLGWLSHVCPTT